MKIELEEQDIRSIAEEVVELLKPMLNRDGDAEDITGERESK